ncbi:Structural maintenance of chromosomes protein 4-like isoformX2 [Phytophthora palmivora]|uniref:Structural maintenance of chromosomes protein 4-like isoformX2 n=1 Tax=Phytophthora palmivora TaxID=4796 RepID=A0A2P4YB96_9STRA|nr:Structural maintenance of chromosomes protein 4-like isoformX2 [Phytophthora palmivora]
MVRLGLSDSMRSTVSIEDTEPLHTASHRRSLRRPLAVATTAATNASRKQQTQSKAISSVLSTALRILLGSILAIVLLSIGVRVFGASLRTWRSSFLQVGEQFERLEKSIELLEDDTTRLKTTADRFLQNCQEAQVAASTRTEMLQNIAKRSFDEQMTTQMQEHEQVMKDVLRYYAQQEQKVMETRERLIKMNITLPVQVGVRSVPETWKQDEQKLLQEQGLSDTIDGLAVFAEKTPARDGGDDQQMSFEHREFQTGGNLESNNRRKGGEHTSSFGLFFFYVIVFCFSAIYLRNAIANTRKKELMEDKWSWSPVPKVLSTLKKLLSSIVVIEDLRTSSNTDDTTNSPEHIEHIELR